VHRPLAHGGRKQPNGPKNIMTHSVKIECPLWVINKHFAVYVTSKKGIGPLDTMEI
jgi:hypothetical protein